MADDTIREDVVKRFHTIPGLGLTKAEILFDSGYTTVNSLKRATVEELSSVTGINPPLARYILREVKDMKDGVDVPSEEAETVATPSGDDETASITVSEEAPAQGSEDVDGAEAAEPSADGGTDEGGGFLGGFVNTIKSFFGGGGKEEEVVEDEVPVEEEPVEDETPVEKEAMEDEAPPEEQTTEAEEPQVEDTPEAQITVGQREEPKTEEGSEAEEEGGPEPEHEPMTEEPPTGEPKERSLVGDIKAKGLARIKALRERIYGKKKEKDEDLPEDQAEEPEPEEEPIEEKKEEEAVEEKKEEVKQKTSKKTSKKPEEDKKLVDNIIKELDLDGEDK